MSSKYFSELLYELTGGLELKQGPSQSPDPDCEEELGKKPACSIIDKIVEVDDDCVSK
jgi:hypothetical protein